MSAGHQSDPAPQGLGVGRPTKRRPGTDAGGLAVAESRPQLVDGGVVGSRCTACGYPSAQVGLPWCPACQRGEMPDTTFAPLGAVWSSAVVQIRVLNRRAPFALAYVDLDDGPRVLARLGVAEGQPPGTRVKITRVDDGDLIAELEEDAK